MKIKDLIEELSKLNPESTVLFSNTLECFRSNSGCAFEGELHIEEMSREDLEEELDNLPLEDHEDESDFDDEEGVKGRVLEEVGDGDVVHILISGEENWNQ